MSCRRIRRELLWLARFGDFGPSSAPHLDHLASCRSCRDEIGFDRVLVQQLRYALAARIETEKPSSRAWEGVLARTRQPQPGLAVRLRERSYAFVSRLRVATAIAGSSLALVLALNLEVVSLAPPIVGDELLDSLDAPATAGPSRGEGDGHLNLERGVPIGPSGLAIGTSLTTWESQPAVDDLLLVGPGRFVASRDQAVSVDPTTTSEQEPVVSDRDRPLLMIRLVLLEADRRPMRSAERKAAEPESAPTPSHNELAQPS